VSPANDNIDKSDDIVANCQCGCGFYEIVLREGLHYVLCAQCGHDHTMTTVWGKHREGDAQREGR
jgi:hypothetical protein